MSELLQGILIALLPALAVSIITAYIAVRLSLKQFYSQRWWDKKAEAYSLILEHLSYLKYYYGEWIDELQLDITMSEDHQKRLNDGYQQSKESIIKAAAIGEFIISETAGQAVAKLLSELTNLHFEADLNTIVERSYAAAGECIKTVKEEAKEALSKMIH
jgi:hypothetical protein